MTPSSGLREVDGLKVFPGGVEEKGNGVFRANPGNPAAETGPNSNAHLTMGPSALRIDARRPP